jgi:hypothetical protein
MRGKLKGGGGGGGGVCRPGSAGWMRAATECCSPPEVREIDISVTCDVARVVT